MRNGNGASRRGAVLIVVLGVLVVLAMLGITFASLSQVERTVSSYYLDLVRAKLLAKSGVEDGLARLKGVFPASAISRSDVARAYLYYGGESDESRSPQPTTPLEDAVNPSFAVERDRDPSQGGREPEPLLVEGKIRGYSGASSAGTYAANGDQYVLRVSDLSGLIYVNDGVEQGNGGSVSRNLARILNVLGQAAGLKAGTNLGDEILANRPPGGYTSKAQLIQSVGYDLDEFRKFERFVTIHAWVDSSVANPVPLSSAVLSQYPVSYTRPTDATGRTLYRFGKQKDANNDLHTLTYDWIPRVTPSASSTGSDRTSRVYGQDTLHPQWIEIVGRAPVNLNTAPKEVLVALLTDLHGWFLADRRRSNPRWTGDLYASFRQETTYSSLGDDSDEIGYITATIPLAGPGSSGPNSAVTIAEHLQACREDRATDGVTPAFDYKGLWYAGPFREWRQFNAFCDNLVVVGVLLDDRPIHFDYDPASCGTTGYSSKMLSSDVQRRHASRAMADVLKANFNPNLHLNETNPDANLFTIVDKTDLVVNSTEFTFLPTGFLEVESLGRVLRPVDPDRKDVLQAGTDCRVMAQSKLVATVKIYDLIRETTQQQFYGGELAGRTGPFPTNNNRSLEVGPEPDQGEITTEVKGEESHEWDGYVQLATYGGNFTDAATVKPRNTTWKTMENFDNGGRHLEADVCVHFAHDMDAHHHKLGADARAELGSSVQPDENVVNFADPDETLDSPYDPTDGGGRRYRVARSFRVPKGATSTVLAVPGAPSDLRLDGAQLERNAAASYAASRGGSYLFNYTAGRPSGVASFWVKPAYFPELTGKVRSIWDHSRFHTPCPSNTYVTPFALWFFPSFYDSATAETTNPAYWGNNIGKFHPSSFCFGSKQWHEPGVNAEYGNVSRSLNHIGHDDEATRRNILQGHRWTHVAFAWKVDGRSTHSTMYINGASTEVPYTYSSMTNWPNDGYRSVFDHRGGASERNHLRLGAPSEIATAAKTSLGYRGNHATDATYDEFHVWGAWSITTGPGTGGGNGNGNGGGGDDRRDPDPVEEDPIKKPAKGGAFQKVPAGLWEAELAVRGLVPPVPLGDELDNRAKLQWTTGRYYKPDSTAFTDSTFTSQDVEIPAFQERTLAREGSGISGFGGLSMVGGASPSAIPRRILGVSWSWYSENMEEVTPGVWRPTLTNHNAPVGSTNPPLLPKVELQVETAGVPSAWVGEDSYSAVGDSEGMILPLPTDTMKYRVRFRIDENGNGDSLNWVLLATPVLDDVTLFVSSGEVLYLDFSYDNLTSGGTS